MTDYTIHQIETLTEQETAALADGKITIKGHAVYFVDLGDYFGFSALVFFDGAPIMYANEYGLHYRERTRGELRALYIKRMADKLFSDAEICAPVKSYAEYTQKAEYLVNLYPLRKPYISAFYIGDNAPDTTGMIYDPISFSYFAPEHLDFVKHHQALYAALRASYKAARKDFDFLKGAFLREMENHEYGYNWDGDEEVLIACGFNPRASLNDVARRAYNAARSEYLANFVA